MKKKYTIDEFKKIFNEAEIKILDDINNDDMQYLKKGDTSDTKIAKFKQNQMLSAMLYMGKLYGKIFEEK